MKENIKLGFIGLGQRGYGLLNTVLDCFDDVEVTAVCDVYDDRAEAAAKFISERRGVAPAQYTDCEKLIADGNVNTIIVSASWEAHVPLAIEIMKAGKILGLEVGGAYSLDDCYRLVRTYEETKTPFMFLENCCYGKLELMTTNMARKGTLGEIVYCHGAYAHYLCDEIAGGIKNRHYRLRNYLIRNCDNYPTHELGPIAKLLNINRGNRMLKLTSLSSKARGMHEYVADKPEFDFLKDKDFRQGDIVVTTITCADGSLITLKLDTTLPRAYSREFSVSGTKGMISECGNVAAFGHTPETVADYEDDYVPSIWKDMTEQQYHAGHGGIDFLELTDFFNRIRSGEEMALDVYDAAAWMAITCLSEISIANGGQPVDIPDFTGGKWVMREPQDVIDFGKEGPTPERIQQRLDERKKAAENADGQSYDPIETAKK